MRERGLKLVVLMIARLVFLVAPHAGAWIEIVLVIIRGKLLPVAPHAGAWIEILIFRLTRKPRMSLPMRERGLKFNGSLNRFILHCRSPCGSVD